MRSNSRGLALARAGHVERGGPRLGQPAADLGRRWFVEIDNQMRLPMPLGEPQGELGPSAWTTAAEDQRGVAVEGVPLGPHRVLGRVGLRKQIDRGDRSVFRPTALGAPAAVRNVVTNRPVEDSSIRSRLATGNDAGDKLFEK